MKRNGLTDLELKKLVKDGKPIAKADRDGLTFTLSAKGTATWVLRYRYGGRQREITVGRWPDVSLAQARIEALELRLRIAKGEHVAAAKRTEKAATAKAGTVAELAEDYLATLATRVRSSTLRQRRRLFDVEILPSIGRMRPDTLPTEEVSALVRRIARRSQSTSIIVLVAVRGMFAHGNAAGIINHDPTTRLETEALIGKREAKRERRALTRDELPLFLAQIESTGAANCAALKLLLLTGVRKSELQTARWENVNLEAGTWFVPPDNKTGRAYRIPLVPAAVESFEHLRLLFPTGEYVMAQHGGRSHGKATSPGRLNFALDSLKGLGKIRPHNLRHTMRTYLGELGTRVEVAERCLNHSLGGLVEVYDRSDYLEERRQALQKWADFLDELQRGDKVTSIRGKAA